MPGNVEAEARLVAERDGEVGVEGQAGADALYERALACVQRGRWAEAQDALAELKVRYPESAALRAVQEELDLHLSAERTWSVEARRRAARKKPSGRVRVLAIGNIVLYVGVGVVWLLLQLRRLLN